MMVQDDEGPTAPGGIDVASEPDKNPKPNAAGRAAADQARADRRAASLRENLHKRKALQRSRTSRDVGGDGEPRGPDPSDGSRS